MVSQRTTDTHVYFWAGMLSNFYKAAFEQSLWRNGPPVAFRFNEAYIMAGKALLFGSVDGRLESGDWYPSVLERILDARQPKDAKDLGRSVPGFDEAVWRRHAKNIAFRGAWARFTQNPDLLEFLIRTEDRRLVEGSPYDRIWGVGLAWDDPKIDDENNWRGTNWLGDVNEAVRSMVIENIDNLHDYDPFTFDFN